MLSYIFTQNILLHNKILQNIISRSMIILKRERGFNMKQLLAIFLAISMLFCLSACGKEKITLELAHGTREGYYTGDLVDGLPDGKGKFVSQNESGAKWTYEGEFTKGHFDGQGKTTWSNGQVEIGTYKNDVIVPMKGEEIKTLYTNPKDYKNYCVEIIGKVFSSPEVDEDGIAFQMWADPEISEKNTMVYVHDTSLELKDGDYVKIVGLVGDPMEGENALGGKVSAVTIRARECTKLSYKDAIAPTVKTVEVNQTQTQFGYAVTVQKIEFAEKETRVYVKVDNKGSAAFSLYSFNTKLSQNGKQFEEEDNWDADYPEIKTELLPGNSTEGIIVFPVIDQTNFNLMLDGSSDNYRENIKSYQFKINL